MINGGRGYLEFAEVLTIRRASQLDFFFSIKKYRCPILCKRLVNKELRIKGASANKYTGFDGGSQVINDAVRTWLQYRLPDNVYLKDDSWGRGGREYTHISIDTLSFTIWMTTAVVASNLLL
jgi:hypothetical protein